MKRIFGQKTTKPWGKMGDFAAVMTGPTRAHKDRALGRNLMYDDRVPASRAGQFYRQAKQPGTEAEFTTALDDYLIEQVRPYPAKTFLAKGNRINLAARGPEFLARVLDVSGLPLRDLLRHGRGLGIREWRLIDETELVTDTGIDKVLTEWLSAGGTRSTFIDALLKALNSNRRETAHNPSWVADWDGFLRNTDGTAESWLEAVGVPRPVHPRWIVVLRYRSAGIQLARPTQLEAGTYSYHFPSPRFLKSHLGGHSMSLSGSRGSPLGMVAEFIHEEIDHDLTHWDAAGSLCEKTLRAVGQDLPRYRRRHYRHLKNVYGTARISKWMPKYL